MVDSRFLSLIYYVNQKNYQNVLTLLALRNALSLYHPKITAWDSTDLFSAEIKSRNIYYPSHYNDLFI